ncbi:16S rRNA (cytosine(1402)-N(4))-methyltransferase RsmH [Minwuia thermotolerans]|uniref:Ribosomal RNA small subunit methyltransferase H n=1 Tax=Minwuia thermotolerans TaxID=2056226 RepID=A0A2M9G249_9PROT|nr:16S rRNA (cytosine(1402)-N(4))-methyltransferase RsmH [Minwuia thermotolerans]PJK29760.1 16S rRNA (cytosine(1402)-N(4))-methyltransferase [Minwuia thermotolerans]
MSAHLPVMLDEVTAALRVRDGGRYVDCTFGLGGYTAHWLASADCRVYAIDRDPDAIAAAEVMAEAHGGRLTPLHGAFGDMETLLRDADAGAVDGVAMDLGVSSPQLDRAERGFSFLRDGPLDMRMSRSGETAADIVNTWEESRLADLFYHYGEERRSRPAARAVVRARDEAPIDTTGRLAEIIAAAIPAPGSRIHPATRVFQALRIAVNDELGELRRGLRGAERVLAEGGRLAVVSFHSLEDRLVKRFLTERSGAEPRGSRHRPEAADGREPSFRLLKRGAIKPGDAEIERNPRARSARLRVAERSAAAPWPPGAGTEDEAA